MRITATLLCLVLPLMIFLGCDGGPSPTEQASAKRSVRSQSEAAHRAEFHRLVRTAGEASRAGELAEAIRQFRLALEMQPESEAAAVGLAQLMMSSGRVDQATKLLQRVVKNDPRNARALMWLSQLHSELRPGGNVDLVIASEYCERALKVNGEDTAVWLQRGRLAQRRGDTKLAYESLQATLDTNPSCGEAAVLIAQLHVDDGDVAEAAQGLVAFLSDYQARTAAVPDGATEEGDTATDSASATTAPLPVQHVASMLAAVLRRHPKLPRPEGLSGVNVLLPKTTPPLPQASDAGRLPRTKGATYLEHGPCDARARATVGQGDELKGFLSNAFVTAAASTPGKRLVIGAVHDGAPNDLLFFELDGRLPDDNELPRFRIVMDHVVTGLCLDGDLLACAIDGEGFRLLSHGKGAASVHDVGAWHDVTGDRGLPTDLFARSVILADLDGDGTSDLCIGQASGGVRVFMQSSEGQFSEANAGFLSGQVSQVIERMEIGKTDDGKPVVFLDTGSDAIFTPRQTFLMEAGPDGTQRITAPVRGQGSPAVKRVSVTRIL